jgi:hypothetical protein
MKDLRTMITRRAVSLSVLIAVALVLAGFFCIDTTAAFAQSRVSRMSWDIPSFSSFSPPTFGAGGHASARANDGSMITVTGSGTFRALGVPSGPLFGFSFGVNGGGTWETFDKNGSSTGIGTYQVRSLDRFVPVAGAITSPPFVDQIGNAADARSGLAIFRIRYSDGQKGFVVVSCSLPGAPSTGFEGITAIKESVDYWNRVAPVDGVDGNRTVFHVLSAH